MHIVDRYRPFLEQVLTPMRLRHSLGVMQVMGELAGVYGLDRDTALAAGLLHDAAKDLDEACYMALVKVCRELTARFKVDRTFFE